jgi:hypothetical protein
MTRTNATELGPDICLRLNWESVARQPVCSLTLNMSLRPFLLTLRALLDSLEHGFFLHHYKTRPTNNRFAPTANTYLRVIHTSSSTLPSSRSTPSRSSPCRKSHRRRSLGFCGRRLSARSPSALSGRLCAGAGSFGLRQCRLVKRWRSAFARCLEEQWRWAWVDYWRWWFWV